MKDSIWPLFLYDLGILHMNLRSFRRNQCGRLVLNIYRKVWIFSKRKKKSILNDKKFFIRDIISFRDNVKEFSKNIE